MISKLVTFCFCTRVVVPDDADEDDILAAATENMRQRLGDNFTGEFADNWQETEQDIETPYNPETEKETDFGVYPTLESIPKQ